MWLKGKREDSPRKVEVVEGQSITTNKERSVIKKRTRAKEDLSAKQRESYYCVIK